MAPALTDGAGTFHWWVEMRTIARFLFALVIVAGLGLALTFYLAGRAAGPTVEVESPTRLVGRTATLDVRLEAPGGAFTRAEAMLLQGGSSFPLFDLHDTGSPATVTQESATRMRLVREFGRQSIPDLRAGPAQIVVKASRPVMFGIRTAETTFVRDVEVRLTPPRLSVLSTHHHVNHGGAELVVYRVTPADAMSGVRVGDVLYPGYSATEAGLPADPDVRIAFFALLYDQDLTTPISLLARDEAGNETVTQFDYRPFPKAFRRGRIELSDAFMRRIVPHIAEFTPAMAIDFSTPEELLEAFLFINRDLRQQNAEQISAFAAQTSPRMMWRGPFKQLANSKVEAGFADYRTYYYRGAEVDRQVHLGYDLAVTAAIPILAANAGRVMYADFLGIYGNTVIIDHGIGIQSLYAHLSSIDVSAGDLVEQDQQIGRSGMTGLAGGDHLHFTMLLNGHAVTPVEWWDPKWLEDRVMRKLRAIAQDPVLTLAR
jgi:murein DD-endopeptidase MepM/ murein hydrolase activator NlpD